MRDSLASLLLILVASNAHAEEISFNRDIRPILSDACFHCHGPDSAHREADLRLDVEASAKEFVIEPGDSEGSELMQRLVSDDPDEVMPPPQTGKSLTPAQIKLLSQWIDRGAVYEPYWAYVAPKRHNAPEVDSTWPSDPVDQFVLAPLASGARSVSPDADRPTLIRRLMFDLIGLPPSREEVAEFAADPNPDAYAKLVDRLLASPAFGERMAIYWLDLVRYADTVGYHGDQDHAISPYRDYVVDAFNNDLPLDQFTREQLAGDLLPNPTQSQIVATGYNRLLQTSHEGGVQPKEYLAIYAADRIRNVSAVWMGATVGCAQCHDHKYDPYTIHDFYSMVAFFADIDEQQHFSIGSNVLPTKRPPEISVLTPEQLQQLAVIESSIGELKKQLADQELADQELADQELADQELADQELADQQLADQQLADQEPADSKLLQDELARWELQRDQIRKLGRLTMVTQAIPPREIRVLPRGNWLDDSGLIVEPAIPAFLGKLETGDRRASRLDLADWLVDVDSGVGGMTARVFANRFWYLLMGRGMSSSLADFGGQGEPPSHPELLDQLAVDFVQDGWSVKRMLRRLVLSRTYRQASDTTDEQQRIDPENRSFARQSRYRLPAEMVRDSALSISGLLVRDVGGASVKPHQPAGYYRHLNFPKRIYTPDRESGQYRRGVYVHWQRQFLHPMLKAMDAPSREECTAQRPRSNTPLEALVLLNDPSMVDAAIAFASRILRIPADSERDRLTAGFQIAVSRQPDVVELAALEKLLQTELQHYATHLSDAESLIDSADDAIDVTVAGPAELASWTSVARALLNMYETVTRN